jgi:hypothetical protein
VPQTRWETAVTARYAITSHLDGRVAYREERSSAATYGGDRADLLRTQRVVGFDLAYAFD